MTTEPKNELPDDIKLLPEFRAMMAVTNEKALMKAIQAAFDYMNTRPAKAVKGDKAEALIAFKEYMAQTGLTPQDEQKRRYENIWKHRATIENALTPESEGIAGKGEGLARVKGLDKLQQAESQIFWLCTELKDDKQNEIANAALENIRAALQSTLARPQEIDVEQLKASVKKKLLPEVFPKGAPIHEDKAEWDFCSGLVSGIGLTIDHLAAAGYLSGLKMSENITDDEKQRRASVLAQAKKGE